MQDTNETPKQYQCRHIFTDGHRCASPCLRGEDFCYYHHTTRKPVANPRGRRSRRTTFDLPLPEDRSSIQHSIGQVLQRIASNDIDPRRAGLLLYGLQIASLNLPKSQSAPTRDRDSERTEPQTVDEITLDSDQRILAPQAEFNAPATCSKSSAQLMLEKMLNDPEPETEGEIERRHERERAENARRAAIVPTLKAESAPETSPHDNIDRSFSFHVPYPRRADEPQLPQARYRITTKITLERNFLMKRLLIFCLAAALAFTTTACNTSTDTREADTKAIQDAETQWNADYAAKDTNKILAHYADDAILIVPGGPSTSGKDAIGTALKEMVADPAMALKFHAAKVDVAKSGDLAYTQGTYTLTFTDPQTKHIINDHGSYVTTYRKQPDGSWKAVADIATSEVPPPPPAPAAKPSHKTKPQPKTTKTKTKKH
jgi:uncharacterized protein (TIGR02246 family)